MTTVPLVRSIDTRAYTVPTDTPEADGTLDWSATTLVVVRVHAGDVTGLGWTYIHAAAVEVIGSVLAPVVEGLDALDVPACWQAMQRAVRNLGRPGMVSCAMSAVDIALWDAKARLLSVPLCGLLGRVRESVPVYGSGGFTNDTDSQLRKQLVGWVENGLPATKIKIGEEWGRAEHRDLARSRFARSVLGSGIDLYVDANGAYSVGQAVRIAKALNEFDVTWFEEPVSSDDLAGLRQVRGSSHADVTAGEYGYHLPYFEAMLDAQSVDCLQIDVTRCGGYSEWYRVAALAGARNVEVSAHCAQNLSAHIAVATPNMRHLEWFHDHARTDQLLFDGVLDPAGGYARPDFSAAGHGFTLKEADAEQYRVA